MNEVTAHPIFGVTVIIGLLGVPAVTTTFTLLLEPLTVKVGDEVLYGKYAGTEISVNGRDYLIMRESDIFAIL